VLKAREVISLSHVMIIRATIVCVISVWDHKVLPKYPILTKRRNLNYHKKIFFQKELTPLLIFLITKIGKILKMKNCGMLVLSVQCLNLYL